jgi:lytic murein transglycosylase B
LARLSFALHRADPHQCRREIRKANRATLQRASQEFGVPPEVIVGIIGVETIYGRYMGNFRVLDALTTLTFDYPDTPNRDSRQATFRKNLEDFLVWTRDSQLDPTTVLGSYTGAIGIPQFLPSSIREYAVDYDGGGHVDLRSSPADAIGSVANYLKQHGWETDRPVVWRITPDTGSLGIAQAAADGQPEPHWALSQLLRAGMTLNEPTVNITTEAGTPVTVVDLPSPGHATEYMLGLKNFYVLTRYNRSFFYALACRRSGESANGGERRTAAAARRHGPVCAISSVRKKSAARCGAFFIGSTACGRGPRSRRKHAGRQVTVAAVADDEHDRRVLDLRAMRIATSQAPPDEIPAKCLRRREPARHRFGRGLAHVLDAIDAAAIEDRRHVGFRPLANARNARAVFRLRADDLDRRLLLLQIARRAHDRARRAHRGHEVRDASFGVAPDLRTGRLVMRDGVVRVAELVEDHALAFALHLLGEVARQFHAALHRRQDDFRAVRGHALAALDRQILRHDQHHLVAADRAAIASAMPVLPLVASISVSPGLIRPRASALLIIDSAGRSFTEPAGLLPSSFASTTLLRARISSSGRRTSCTSGVLPIVSSIVL